MKYAVVGADGQLGRAMCPRLGSNVVPLILSQLDLTCPGMVRSVLGDLRPDVVINCAAYNLVDRAESEPESAFAVNAWGVRTLAAVCRDLDCVLVHFSTDYIFGLDETRRTPYRETDAPGPLGVYGLSKLAGEYLARSISPKHIVIRTCGLYGLGGTAGKGTNFVETMLRLAAQGKSLRIVADQICTPSYTVDVALAAIALVQACRFGLYHVTNGGSCTWYECAQAVFELAKVRVETIPITSQEYGAIARRPSYSVLAKEGYESLALPPLRPWREALTAYLEERRQIE